MYFLVLSMPFVSGARAAELPSMTEADINNFNQILDPVFKTYNFIKYFASVVAVVFLLIAGIQFMTAGSDSMKRETAKNRVAYVLMGLFVAWAAPHAVGYLL